jgi:hypothetical protein
MRWRKAYIVLLGSILLASLLITSKGWTAESIIIGVPTSLGSVEGKEGIRPDQMVSQ